MGGLPDQAAMFLILFARVGAILMLLPAFSEDSIPPRIRLLAALGFTAGLSGMVSSKIGLQNPSDLALPGIIIAEVLVGLAMGMIVKIMFYAAAMAGSLISLQVGLSSAMIFDPGQSGQSPLIGKLVSITATVVCLGFGVHHLWIGSIVQSYGVFPVGGLPPGVDFAQLAVSVISKTMGLALSLAAPLIVYGIVFNAALALSARMAPAIQVFFIAQPLNIMLGLALFATISGTLLATFASTMAAWMSSSWG